MEMTRRGLIATVLGVVFGRWMPKPILKVNPATATNGHCDPLPTLTLKSLNKMYEECMRGRDEPDYVLIPMRFYHLQHDGIYDGGRKISSPFYKEHLSS